jgi:hypothetical protein
MLHIFNTIIDETTVARSRWQGNSERRREPLSSQRPDSGSLRCASVRCVRAPPHIRAEAGDDGEQDMRRDALDQPADRGRGADDIRTQTKLFTYAIFANIGVI